MEGTDTHRYQQLSSAIYSMTIAATIRAPAQDFRPQVFKFNLELLGAGLSNCTSPLRGISVTGA